MDIVVIVSRVSRIIRSLVENVFLLGPARQVEGSLVLSRYFAVTTDHVYQRGPVVNYTKGNRR